MTLPMEKATYRAKAISAGFGESESDKASRFVAIGCEIVDDVRFVDETLTWLGYFTEKTTARTLESLMHMGFQSDDLTLLEDIGPNRCAELLPNVFEIVVEPDEYQGEWRLKVQWINRPGTGRFKAKKPLVGAELEAFAAQMKRALRNARYGRKAASNGASSVLTTRGDDDLPF